MLKKICILLVVSLAIFAYGQDDGKNGKLPAPWAESYDAESGLLLCVNPLYDKDGNFIGISSFIVNTGDKPLTVSFPYNNPTGVDESFSVFDSNDELLFCAEFPLVEERCPRPKVTTQKITLIPGEIKGAQGIFDKLKKLGGKGEELRVKSICMTDQLHLVKNIDGKETLVPIRLMCDRDFPLKKDYKTLLQNVRFTREDDNVIGKDGRIWEKSKDNE